MQWEVVIGLETHAQLTTNSKIFSGAPIPFGAEPNTQACPVDLALPVILVVGLRLGCINHALLSAEAIRARGLTLAGWVANCVDPEMAHLADNLETLADPVHGLQAECWGYVPRLVQPDPAAVAAHLSRQMLLAFIKAQ